MNKVYKVIQWQACVTFHEKEKMNINVGSNSYKVEPRTAENYSEALQFKKFPHLCQSKLQNINED